MSSDFFSNELFVRTGKERPADDDDDKKKGGINLDELEDKAEVEGDDSSSNEDEDDEEEEEDEDENSAEESEIDQNEIRAANAELRQKIEQDDAERAYQRLRSKRVSRDDYNDFDEDDLDIPRNDSEGKIFKIFVAPQKQTQIVIYLTELLIQKRREAENNYNRSTKNMNLEEKRNIQYTLIPPKAPTVFATPLDKDHVYIEAQSRAEVEKLIRTQMARQMGIKAYAYDTLSERQKVIQSREGTKKRYDYNKHYIEEVDIKTVQNFIRARITDIIPVKEGTFVKIAKHPIYQGEVAYVDRVYRNKLKVDLLVLPKIDVQAFLDTVTPIIKADRESAIKDENEERENENLNEEDFVDNSRIQQLTNLRANNSLLAQTSVNETKFHSKSIAPERLSLGKLLVMSGYEQNDIDAYYENENCRNESKNEFLSTYPDLLGGTVTNTMKDELRRRSKGEMQNSKIAAVLARYFNTGIVMDYTKQMSTITRSRNISKNDKRSKKSVSLQFKGGLLLLKDIKISALSTKNDNFAEELNRLMIKYSINPMTDLMFRDGCVYIDEEESDSENIDDIEDDIDGDDIGQDNGETDIEAIPEPKRSKSRKSHNNGITNGESNNEEESDENNDEDESDSQNKNNDDIASFGDENSNEYGNEKKEDEVSQMDNNFDDEPSEDGSMVNENENEKNTPLPNVQQISFSKPYSCRTFFDEKPALRLVNKKTRINLQRCYNLVNELLYDASVYVDGACRVLPEEPEDVNVFVEESEVEEIEEIVQQVENLVPISKSRKVIVFGYQDNPLLNFAHAFVKYNRDDIYVVELSQPAKINLINRDISSTAQRIKEIEINRRNLITYADDHDWCYVKIASGIYTGMSGKILKTATNKREGRIYLSIELYISSADGNNVRNDVVGNVEIDENGDPYQVYGRSSDEIYNEICENHPFGIMDAKEVINYVGCFTTISDMVEVYTMDKMLNRDGFQAIGYEGERIECNSLVEFKPEVIKNHNDLFEGCKYGMILSISRIAIVFLLSNDKYIKMALNPTKVDISEQEKFIRLEEVRKANSLMAKSKSGTITIDDQKESTLPFTKIKRTSDAMKGPATIKNRRFDNTFKAKDMNNNIIDIKSQVEVNKLDNCGPSCRNLQITPNSKTIGTVLYTVFNADAQDQAKKCAMLYVKPTGTHNTNTNCSKFVIPATNVKVSSGIAGTSRGTAGKLLNTYWSKVDFEIGQEVVATNAAYSDNTGVIVSYAGGDTAFVDFGDKKDDISVHFLKKKVEKSYF